ncbi:MAG: DUF192 domain-containing protein [Deltaproteobacteria bacterium]|nr:DUF192 domain-containing protein [Deltaproteobacteria bacterium]
MTSFGLHLAYRAAWPVALLLLPPLGACERPGGGDARAPGPSAAEAAAEVELPTGEVIVRPLGHPEVRVRVEFALTDRTRERGLMFRRELDQDAGMLFVFSPPARRQVFWMRNTYVPLDMIFIDDALRVVGIVERAEPLTDTPRAVPGDSCYVLEVNAGFARAHGLGPGARIEILGLDGAPEPAAS